MPIVQQELPTLPDNMSSLEDFSGFRVTRSLVVCVCIVDGCLSFSVWPLRYLSLFDLRIQITHLVSSNSSFFFACIVTTASGSILADFIYQ